MNSMTKLPDCNINGAIISTSKEELSKENQFLSNTNYQRKKTREAKHELFISNEQGKQIVKEKTDTDNQQTKNIQSVPSSKNKEVNKIDFFLHSTFIVHL